eukprot:scaffold248950_cov19-Tisochrysis_lutea.AAC.2
MPGCVNKTAWKSSEDHLKLGYKKNSVCSIALNTQGKGDHAERISKTAQCVPHTKFIPCKHKTKA